MLVDKIIYCMYFFLSLCWLMASLGETVKLKIESEEIESTNTIENLLAGKPWQIDLRWIKPFVNTIFAFGVTLGWFLISLKELS